MPDFRHAEWKASEEMRTARVKQAEEDERNAKEELKKEREWYVLQVVLAVAPLSYGSYVYPVASIIDS